MQRTGYDPDFIWSRGLGIPCPKTLHPLTLLEGDIHQPLIELLNPPEIVDHFSG